MQHHAVRIPTTAEARSSSLNGTRYCQGETPHKAAKKALLLCRNILEVGRSHRRTRQIFSFSNTTQPLSSYTQTTSEMRCDAYRYSPFSGQRAQSNIQVHQTAGQQKHHPALSMAKCSRLWTRSGANLNHFVEADRSILSTSKQGLGLHLLRNPTISQPKISSLH
jgi:hypothetical protein